MPRSLRRLLLWGGPAWLRWLVRLILLAGIALLGWIPYRHEVGGETPNRRVGASPGPAGQLEQIIGREAGDGGRERLQGNRLGDRQRLDCHGEGVPMAA